MLWLEPGMCVRLLFVVDKRKTLPCEVPDYFVVSNAEGATMQLYSVGCDEK